MHGIRKEMSGKKGSMVERIQAKDLDGMRPPTEEERESIVQYYERLYGDQNLNTKRFGAVAVVLGILCLFGYVSGSSLMLIVAIAFFGLAAFMIGGKKVIKPFLAFLRTGDFTVTEGTVCGISATAETPGVKNVRFRSAEGRETQKMYPARQEGLSIGTPLILVYADKEKAGYELNRVFTPFMLSEKGLNGPLFG